MLYMIKYAQAIVWVNNFTMFTVRNVERVGTMSVLEMESALHINLVSLS